MFDDTRASYFKPAFLQEKPQAVCEKWLKDRKGRNLTADDRTHYQKTIIALSETIRLMAEIDTVIAQHGGWPLK